MLKETKTVFAREASETAARKHRTIMFATSWDHGVHLSTDIAQVRCSVTALI